MERHSQSLLKGKINMNIYYYLYYKVYSFIRVIRKDAPHLHANMVTTFLIGVNVLVIMDIIKRRNLDFLSPAIVEMLSSKGIALFNFIVIYIFNYFLFVQNKKYEKLYEQYNKESIVWRLLGSVLVMGYVAISIWSIFYVW